MAEGTPDAARPRAVIRVGVTGHRRVEDVREELAARIGEVLRVVAEALCSVRDEHPACFGAPPPLLRVISPLAEGADRLVARVALEGAKDLPCAVDLQCPLPFPVDVYRRDFEAPGSQDEFDTLLQRASAILVLSGDRGGGEAYAAVGECVLDQSDLLIALWDGGPARGPGGTGDVVARARNRGLPVLHVASNEAGAPARLMASGSDAEPVDWKIALRGAVRDRVQPHGADDRAG